MDDRITRTSRDLTTHITERVTDRQTGGPGAWGGGWVGTYVGACLGSLSGGSRLYNGSCIAMVRNTNFIDSDVRWWCLSVAGGVSTHSVHTKRYLY